MSSRVHASRTIAINFACLVLNYVVAAPILEALGDEIAHPGTKGSESGNEERSTVSGEGREILCQRVRECKNGRTRRWRGED